MISARDKMSPFRRTDRYIDRLVADASRVFLYDSSRRLVHELSRVACASSRMTFTCVFSDGVAVLKPSVYDFCPQGGASGAISKVHKSDRKIGHRRVGEGGEITYKKIQSSQIMGSIQLGLYPFYIRWRCWGLLVNLRTSGDPSSGPSGTGGLTW
ncbi:hypothetical protein EVAR_5296_1 [Eumeta japonica]|uniref:Uncharacterized protein n=1 Tax=Eumeta variegata TaxID=151549 RepID=A0A4C1TNW0_EUMVA|nr:hypothetical protein EVAR_5296_1 [Eumeta japonica]